MIEYEIFPYTWRADQIHVLVEERRTGEIKDYEGIELSYLGRGFNSICLKFNRYSACGWPAQNVLAIAVFKHGKWWSIPNPYRRKL